MSVKKRLIKQTAKYEQYQNYIDNLQANKIEQQDQSLVPFNLAASVEADLLLKKEASRKARNKRKANRK
jgi:hypothetical protein